ncbi:polysaccharide deacetylase family protein [Paenibacillus humicola]|uniref:polysaccharide deacetylase family protein n=1 Tax=Paenibacillus humicola TaxID=3110540 RepID=UPI00237B2379|nr:polysaccharide deacetylase family protein [Paenibacillus humicola]
MDFANHMKSERFLIVHADDYGMCHTTNRAIMQLLDEGAVTSTTLMVNCPWSLEAAAAAAKSKYDVGVHLTLTSEWDRYKWGPVCHSSDVGSLVNELGHFPAASEPVVQSDPEQIRRELVAQIETALRMGVDPTHLDNHMGSLRPFMELYVDLCGMYRLPFRFRKNPQNRIGNEEEIARKADRSGILYPNEIVALPFYLEDGDDYAVTKQRAVDLLKGLKPGVTELVFHPSLDTEELKAITDTWQARRYEFDVFRDPEVQQVIRQEEIRLIGWRELRELQRQAG